MKKLVTLLLVALFAATCVCVGLAEEITLDVIIAEYGNNTRNWFERGGTGMNGSNFTELFEAANPDIKLNLEVVSWNDLATVVSTRISNNNAPDILNTDTFAQYSSEGLLLPVADWCPAELVDTFVPNLLNQSVADGTLWAVPDLASGRMLYYNVDILAEAGVEPPTTWGEIRDVAQAIIDYYGEGEIYPWAVDMTTDEGQACFAYYSWGNGGDFLADGSWVVNSDENVEAVEFVLGLVKDGYTNLDPANETRYTLQDMFGAGKVAMIIGPNSIPTYIADKDSTINYGYVAIPHNEGKEGASVGVMDRVMAFKDDEYPDQAARNEAIGKVVSFFYDDDNYIGWVTMEDFLPATVSAIEAKTAEDPNFSAWVDVLNSAKFYPTAEAAWNDVKVGVINVEQQALTGGDVKTLLDELQASLTK